MQMSDIGEEWQVARRRKGHGRRSQPLQVSLTSRCHQEQQLDIGKTVKRIRDTVTELRCEDVCQKWKESVAASVSAALMRVEQKDCEVSTHQPEDRKHGIISEQMQCVCYGLGPFSSCVSARYQLAMLLLLLDAQQIPLRDCSVYDPAFSSGEKDVLREMGLTVLTENEEGKHLVSKPTIFYMIHCGKALYNNLLWKNWSTQCLPLMVIVGNSFCSMRERMIDRVFKQDYSYISQVVAVCEEKALPCPSRLIDVFSDTAVITFLPGSLTKLSQSTWTDPLEPQYENCPDLEIVLRRNDR